MSFQPPLLNLFACILCKIKWIELADCSSATIIFNTPMARIEGSIHNISDNINDKREIYRFLTVPYAYDASEYRFRQSVLNNDTFFPNNTDTVAILLVQVHHIWYLMVVNYFLFLILS